MNVDAPFNEVVRFHGHSCPGLAIGYRVARAAVEALGLSRSADEELVAIVENDACGVDAIQYMLGCTFGKGNLIFRDYGKHAYTFIRRDTGRAVRILADFPRPPEEQSLDIDSIRGRMESGTASEEDPAAWKRYKALRAKSILNAPADEFLVITFVEVEVPPVARVAESTYCALCGEKVMVTRTVQQGKKRVCIPCGQANK